MKKHKNSILYFGVVFGILAVIILSCKLARAENVAINYPKFQAFDDDGNPLSGGYLYTYLNGTSTAKATYSNYNLATANANPIVLDSRGEATIYGIGGYKFVLQDSDGVTIWTMDNLFFKTSGGYEFYPDSGESDHGDNSTGGTLKDILGSLGTSTKADIIFPHSGSSSQTTYEFTTDYDISSYDNVTLRFSNGAILDGSITLTFNNPAQIIAGPKQQIFGSSITANFTVGGTDHPEWWGIDGTNDEVQIQKAIDALPSDGGTVEFLADTTYVCSVVGTMALLNTEYYCIQPKSNVNFKFNGYNSVVKVADGQGSGTNDVWLFATNTAYTNVTFQGPGRIDLNGSNQNIDINLNTPAIGVSGLSAYAKHITIRDMWFENCAGMNFLILGQYTSSAYTMGDDITIEGCHFYQSALDTDIIDHTAIYSLANNVRILNNFFENESSNTNGWAYSTAWEFHGSNCVATGNVVKRYKTGCLLCSHYVSAAVHQVVQGNNFELMGLYGVRVIRNTSFTALDKLVIDGNNINLYDKNQGTGYGLLVAPTLAVGEIIFSNNIVYGTDDGGAGPPAEQTYYGVGVVPEATGGVQSVINSGNLYRDMTIGALYSSLNAAVKSITDQGNIYRDMVTTGIQLRGTNGLDHLKIADDMFTDDGGNTMDYGIDLNGTVTLLEMNGNSFNNMQTSNIVEQSSYSPTTVIVDGEYLFVVSAAATGGTDTFIITVTCGDANTYALLELDVIGRFAADETIAKRWAATGRLISDAIQDAESSEVISIGDVLKADLTAGNPAAAGSNNQFTITFTNANDSAFNGRLYIRPRTYGTLAGSTTDIKNITVANNQ